MAQCMAAEHEALEECTIATSSTLLWLKTIRIAFIIVENITTILAVLHTNVPTYVLGRALYIISSSSSRLRRPYTNARENGC